MPELEVAITQGVLEAQVQARACAAIAEHRLGRTQSAREHLEEVESYWTEQIERNQGRLPYKCSEDLFLHYLLLQARKVLSQPSTAGSVSQP